MKNVILLISSIILFLACNSTRKMIEKGDYERAIIALVKKMTGKKNKNTEDVKNLELVFQKAQIKDIDTEKELMALNSESKWEKIYTLYQGIENRQNKIKPLLPLISKENYQARFEFINTLERRTESREKTIEYLYKASKQLLENAKDSKNKYDARRSHDFLNRIEEMSTNYRDVRQLKTVAHELGTERIYFSMKNNTSKIIPLALEEELLNMSVTDLNSNWKKYDMRRNQNVDYDSYIIMNLQNLEFSPEREKSRLISDRDEKIIREEKKDSRGKTLKDSSGNIIYTEKNIILISEIEETVQSKSAIIGGKLDWYNVKTKNTDNSEPINVEINFVNKHGRLIKGDIDNLKKENKEMLRGRPLPFPSNETMTLDAADRLKEIIKDFIRSKS
ncbi:MAG: hypothetical protein HOP11_09020 [Saprospiraceae bacterium]|nr:hypothetical protein [Saprospiraceae bacterium]